MRNILALLLTMMITAGFTCVCAEETVSEMPAVTEDPVSDPTAAPTDEPAGQPTQQPTEGEMPEAAETVFPEMPETAEPESVTDAATPDPEDLVCLSEELTIGVGESVTLTEEADTIAADSAKIVTLNGFTVTGKARGVATVTLAKGNTVTEYRITVLSKPSAIYLTPKGKKTISAGQTLALSVSYKKNYGGSYTLTSSDESVACVDEDSMLTALAPGSTVITAMSYNGKKCSLTLTVKDAPDGLTVSDSLLTLGVGEAKTLSAAVTNDSVGDITWRSDDSNVVTVDANGKIVPISEGTAVVTAATWNGCEASCEVTVVPKPTCLTISPLSAEIGVGEMIPLKIDCDQPIKLTVTLSSAKRVRLLTNDMLEGLSGGSCTVTVKTYNGLTAKAKITVKKAPAKISVPAAVTVDQGTKAEIKPTFGSGQGGSYTLSSSDEDVVRIEGTSAVAVGEGTCVCTVTAYNGISADCKVTVIEAPQEIQMNETLLLGYGELYPSAFSVKTASGKAYQGSVAVSFSKSSVISATGSTLLAKAKGVTVMTVKAGTLTKSCTVTVKDYALVHPAEASAHRGGAGNMPENTIAAFRYAAAMGATYAELDVRSAKDGTQVVNHNATIVGDDGKTYVVANYTASQLKAIKSDLCTLKEALKVIRELGMTVEIELKEDADPEKCVAIVNETGMKDKAILFTSDVDQLAAARAEDSEVGIGLTYHVTQSALVKLVSSLGLNTVFVSYKNISSGLVKLCHNMGLKIGVYTVDTASLVAKMRKLGVDFITTNYPQLVLG